MSQSDNTAELATTSRLRTGVRGSELTTFALGGPIATLLEPRSVPELVNLMRLLGAQSESSASRSPRIIGAGSNLLIPDDGVTFPVVRLGREFSDWCFTDGTTLSLEELELLRSGAPCGFLKEQYQETILVFGGASLMSLSRKLSAQGLAGLEFAAGIPASIGGAIVMNAGAHGAAISNLVKRVYLVDEQGKLTILGNRDLNFGYRHAELPPRTLVCAVELELTPGDPALINQRRLENLEYRKQTQPLTLPSAGSVFRNPHTADQKIYAAQLLEAVGLKGERLGGVSFASQHSNWIVKHDVAGRAEEVMALIGLARERVFSTFQIELQAEIVSW